MTARTTLTAAALLGVCVFALTPPAHAQDKPTDKLTPDEARAIGKEAFLWGMHPVAIYHLRYNTAQNEEEPDLRRRQPPSLGPQADEGVARRVATTLNATTLYGFAMLDLSKEPVVVTVAEVKGHYWSLQFHDNYARWWHLIGSQFNAPGPVRRLLLGPNWSGKLPPGFVGADIIQSQSDFAGVLGRVALTDETAEELKAVNAIQDSVTVMSLSHWIACRRGRT